MLALIAACGTISKKVFDNRLSAGIIEYSVSFPELGEESITATLLPETMTYAFTENSFTSHFEAAGGVFKNRIIANRETMTVEHQLKVFRKKVRVMMNETDVIQMLSDYPKMTVVKTEGTDTIAGYPCKKALVIFEEIDVPEIEIYYTDEIKMKSPNWCTQYHEIDGVLMAYEIEEFGIRMRLRAESVVPSEKITKGEEEESSYEDYTPISKESMDVELAQLVETFEL
jgi:hypothetical protein